MHLQGSCKSLLALVCPSLYFSASKPTISKRDLAAALSFLALATAAAAKMLYLKNHKNGQWRMKYLAAFL